MILQGSNISFSYPGESIFNGFHFHLKEGENVVVKGESGSGKSTLFRLILGFERPDEGQIEWENSPLTGNRLRQFRTRTAWLPQDLNIGKGTTLEVMQYPFRFKQSGNSVPSDEQITEIFSDLGLEPDTLQKTFSDLSTGQRQRAGLALCILLKKPVMLLDEPTSALDEASKEKAIQHLLSNSTRSILSTSHDPYWIKRCDRVIDLDKRT